MSRPWHHTLADWAEPPLKRVRVEIQSDQEPLEVIRPLGLDIAGQCIEALINLGKCKGTEMRGAVQILRNKLSQVECLENALCPSMKYLLAKRTMQSIAELVLNPPISDQAKEGCLIVTEIIVSCLIWYLEFQSKDLPPWTWQTSSGEVVDSGIPPFNVWPDGPNPNPNLAPAVVENFKIYFNNKQPFLKRMEEFICSAMQIVDTFNTSVECRDKISNLITWSWRNIPDSLTWYWPHFTAERMKGMQVQVVINKFNIKLDGRRYLTHATSVENFKNMLYKAKLDGKSELVIEGNKSSVQYSHPKLVWCGVCLHSEEYEDLGSDVAFRFNSRGINSYGSVALRFPCENVLKDFNEFGYILGTRKYRYEYSQTLYIPPKGPETKHFFIEARGVRELEKIKLADYEWSIESTGKEWTHPELAFFEKLVIPIKELSVRFHKHNCIERKRKDCSDCVNGIKLPDLSKSALAKYFSDDPELKVFIQGESYQRIFNTHDQKVLGIDRIN